MEKIYGPCSKETSSCNETDMMHTVKVRIKLLLSNFLYGLLFILKEIRKFQRAENGRRRNLSIANHRSDNLNCNSDKQIEFACSS